MFQLHRMRRDIKKNISRKPSERFTLQVVSVRIQSKIKQPPGQISSSTDWFWVVWCQTVTQQIHFLRNTMFGVEQLNMSAAFWFAFWHVWRHFASRIIKSEYVCVCELSWNQEAGGGWSYSKSYIFKIKYIMEKQECMRFFFFQNSFRFSFQIVSRSNTKMPRTR